MAGTTPNARNRKRSKPVDPLELEQLGCFSFPQKKKAITILLVGETGSGKTSFMSLLLNLFEGRGPFELKDKHLASAQSGLDKTQSQTTRARVYHLTTTRGVEFQILDTPGLADTRGIEEDKKHKARIYRAIQELITDIDAVMIVANGTVERLTVVTDYTLNILATLFPRSMIDNIGIIFTNVHGGSLGLNFQIQSLPSELQNIQYWCLNNPLSFYKRYSTLNTGRGVASDRKLDRDIEDNYNSTIRILDNWLQWLDERKAMPTIAIVQLYQKSSHIESRIFKAVVSIESLSKLKSRLSHIRSNLQVVDKEKEGLSSEFKKQLSSRSKNWVLADTSNYNTICTVPGCHSNCHSDCSLEVGDPDNIGGSCRAFKTFGLPNKWLPFRSDAEAKCNRTECGHAANAHRRYQQIHTQVDNKAYKRISQELGRATTKKDMLERFSYCLEEEMKEAKKEIKTLKGEISGLVTEINNLSLSPNYAGYIRSALDLLRMRKRKLLSYPDSSNELEAISEGIKVFESQLELLKKNETGRVMRVVTRTQKGVASIVQY